MKQDLGQTLDDFIINVIISESGVQQGDVLGPFLFAISIQPLLVELNKLSKSRVDLVTTVNGFALGYLDDISINANFPNMVKIIELIHIKGPEFGITLNLKKCKILMGKRDSIDAADIDYLKYGQLFSGNLDSVCRHPENCVSRTLGDNSYGVVLLGAPLGSDSFVKSFLKKKMLKLNEEIRKLILFDDSHAKWLLFSKVVNSKLNFLLRLLGRKFFAPYFNSVNESLRDIFSSIISCKISDTAWHQACLDIKDGGFGIPNIEESSYAAQIAAASDCKSVLDRLFTSSVVNSTDWFHSVRVSLDHINTFIYDQDNFIVFDELITRRFDKFGKQHFLASFEKLNFLDKFKIKSIKFSESDKARFLSLSCAHAGDFLFAGSSTSNKVVTSTEFAIMCCFRLGLPLPISSSSLRCKICKSSPLFGEKGEHSHCCPAGGFRLVKHNVIVAAICALTSAAGVSTSTSMKNIFPDSTTGKRPDIKLINPNFDVDSKPIEVIDVQITNTGNKSNVLGCSKTSLHAANLSANAKIRKYQSLCDVNSMSFRACIMESHGALNDQFINLIKLCVNKQHLLTNIPSSILSQFWFRYFSLALQQANARMFIAHVAGIHNKEAEAFANFLPDKINSFNAFVVSEMK